MKKILLVPTLLFNFLSSAQSLHWVNTSNTSLSTTAIISDSDGYVYSTGTFSGITDFDPGSGVVELESNYIMVDFNNNGILTKQYSRDIFIQKNDAGGNLVWVKKLGVTLTGNGQNVSYVSDIVADGNGNVYSIGKFSGTIDFDPNSGTAFETGTGVINGVHGYNDTFIHKLDSNGDFVWVKTYGGDAITGTSIDVDENNDVYVCGKFGLSVDLNPNAAVNMATSNGFGDVFVQKYNSSGDQVWSTHFGSTEQDQVIDIKVQNSNNIYISGTFEGNYSLPTTTGVVDLVALNTYNSFVSKLNGNGEFVWIEQINGLGGEIFNATIDIDEQGSLYITGGFTGEIDFDNSVQNSILISAIDTTSSYLMKLDDNGSFVWVNELNNSYNSGVTQVHLDEMGYAYVITNQEQGLLINGAIYNENEYIQIRKFSTTGNLISTINYEDSDRNAFRHADVDSIGNIYIAGEFSGEVNFDPIFNQTIASSNNLLSNDYILKLNPGDNLNVIEQTESIVEVFPNPTSGDVTVKLPTHEEYAQLNIVDYSGQIVYNSQLNNSANNVDLTHLPTGMYLVNVILDSGKLLNSKLAIRN